MHLHKVVMFKIISVFSIDNPKPQHTNTYSANVLRKYTKSGKARECKPKKENMKNIQ